MQLELSRQAKEETVEESRIVRLEVTQDHHAREINELKDSNKALKGAFDSLSRNLSAIKNWVIGGVVFAILQQIGLLELMKKILF